MNFTLLKITNIINNQRRFFIPKIINYPIDGLNIIQAKDLITELNNLGGSASRGLFADAINMSENGGAFKGKISSLLKYNLIDSKEKVVILTNLAINILNSYDTEEEKKLLFKVFINISLFNQIIDRFKNSGINLDILDKILIREYEIDNKNVKKVSKCIIKSLEFLEILDKETGNFDKTILNKFYDIKEDKVVDNIIEQERKKDVIKDLKNVVSKIEKIEPKFGLENDIYELVVYFASKLDPIDKPLEIIEEIIERNDFLTHTKLVFDILKDNLSNNTIDKKNIENLLKALKQDLKIS